MKKLRVLLVDDEIMIREGFKRLFDWDAHDCEVVGEAADGMEALAKIDTLQPDIAIMDINIPIMNGLKVIQLSRIKHPDTAFVIVSGYDDFAYCREALRLQITDYILKPVNYEEFGTCIDNLKIALFQRQSGRSTGQQEERTINGITRYLQEHLAEEISLSVLAEEFHLSGQYISQLFKSEIGVNFLAYLTNIRMEKAKKLLLSTALSLAVISEQSGYGDYRVFTKAFRKAGGHALPVPAGLSGKLPERGGRGGAAAGRGAAGALRHGPLLLRELSPVHQRSGQRRRYHRQRGLRLCLRRVYAHLQLQRGAAKGHLPPARLLRHFPAAQPRHAGRV